MGKSYRNLKSLNWNDRSVLLNKIRTLENERVVQVEIYHVGPLTSSGIIIDVTLSYSHLYTVFRNLNLNNGLHFWGTFLSFFHMHYRRYLLDSGISKLAACVKVIVAIFLL